MLWEVQYSQYLGGLVLLHLLSVVSYLGKYLKDLRIDKSYILNKFLVPVL